MKISQNIILLAFISVLGVLGCTDDTVPATEDAAPVVASTNPDHDAVDVSENQAISVSFDVPMDPETINASTFTLKQGAVGVEGVLTYEGVTATFSPTVKLDAAKLYTVTVSNGVTNKAGIAMAKNYTFSFTTQNAEVETKPEVTSTEPAHNATDIARNKVITITFSEEMDVSTINSTTFTLKQGSTTVAGEVAYSATTASFTPTSNLDARMVYTATITAGAKNLAGNALESSSEWSFATGGTTIASLSRVDMGTAANFVILAKTAINNNPTSSITGDLGLSPAATSYITGLSLTNETGYATSSQVTGKIFAADMVTPTSTNLTTAVDDMNTAYNDAAGRPSPDFLELGAGSIGGLTLSPGLYKWTSTVSIPTNVTLSGGADDIWIFQIAGDLTVSSAVNVLLLGEAQAKNIFWQVAGEATIGTTAHFEGIIISKTGITFDTGATFNGRALAQTAVILDGNTLTKPE